MFFQHPTGVVEPNENPTRPKPGPGARDEAADTYLYDVRNEANEGAMEWGLAQQYNMQ